MLTRRLQSLAFALGAVLILPVAGKAGGPIGVWVPGPPMAEARAGHTATVLKDGRVLVVGLSAEAYDPAANLWLPAGTPAVARSNQTATLLDDGRVLVVGGIDNVTTRSIPNAELYDPTANTWAAAASLPGRRYEHTATLLPDGRVLVVGGIRSTTYLNSADIYDPRTNAWSPAANLSTPRFRHTATLLQDGRVLVAGGTDGYQNLATAELYDPAANRWSPTQPMAAARSYFSATLLKDGWVLVIGGLPRSLPPGGAVMAELFNPATETWYPTGGSTQPLVVEGLAAAILKDGRVFICGGNSPTHLAGAMTSGFVFDPKQGRWFPTHEMTRGRSDHSASVLPDGRVLVAGGFDGTLLNTTEIFEINGVLPSAPTISSAATTSLATTPAATPVGSSTAPLVAAGIAVIAVIALVLITTPLVRRWRRRRGV